MKRILLSVLVVFRFFSCLHAQEVYVHITNKEIYAFLDEMANIKIIELNSAVKPYSRMFIAKKLEEISQNSDKLNKRQSDELAFYLKDFNKELQPDKHFKKRFDAFYYKDSLFTFSINPILGGQYWSNNNGTDYHRWWGAEVFSYVGTHVGIYASLRDNHEDKKLSAPDYLNTRQGGVYKEGNDYSEMRGGIVLSWKWGSFGLVKDHLEWGTNYHYPSIFSAKPPSIAQIKLNLKPVKWLEFNYYHGWLVSDVVDSSRSYTVYNSYGPTYRIVYRNKYIAANMYTFKPMKNFYASIGNSIVYSDMNVHPAYLIPFLLFKSVDHTLNNTTNDAGQNSQFYIDVSSRQIRHLHLYGTLFFDDVSISRWTDNGHLDYYSFNGGFQLSNLIRNVFLTAEYFQSYPLVYKHYIPATNFESNNYNMGHYMQDNSRAVYLELALRPLRGLNVKLSYNFAEHGPDYDSLGTDRVEVTQLFLKSVEWKDITYGISANYQILNDIYVFGEVYYNQITGDMQKYTAPFYYGNTTTWSVGVNYGF
jgi:hypothetical protein